ncbi:hypothetical protein TVAG_056980 [Trichomonas vaginalis G3]|uniref:Uncharacterized protein n=1 Tax=Trichomonas vaginalis (strain ATCC PRA-98 / G3) TaxID=412133 RepID=A2EKA6_TRIV3|nr:hypothetical protein TVAGG3_0772760 [Trichomonas vaginalis G3]EAY06904.1 hypothetical protein TVAG_056980 [Trichomonas vaginalis G3]KAI5513931.1 hypothetical protein TVAGG3_0772760 [Trichomonas vaginalis G3]|eukprot:XP_001319127.1 hypothetical protein [Trichomonas vaginalis G3]
MLIALSYLAIRIPNKRIKLAEDVFENCQSIIDRELKEDDTFYELTINAGECRELSSYSYTLASESDFVVDLYTDADLTKPLKTAKNAFFLNLPLGDDHLYTSTIKCSDSSKECKVQLYKQPTPAYKMTDQGEEISIMVYVTSTKEGKIEFQRKKMYMHIQLS